MPRKASPLVYALAPFAAALATALFLQAWHGSRATELLRTPPRNITFAPQPRTLDLADNLQIIQDRALFYATRKFFNPMLTTSPTTRSQLSNYQLMGTLLLPQRPGVAFLRRGSTGDAMTVSPGNHLDGWTLETVQVGSAVFSYGDQRVTLLTALPFGTTSVAQSLGIAHLPTTRPAQGPTQHASQEQLTRHRLHSLPDRTRGNNN